MKHSIFFNDWQACLRAHYVHVIRTDDAVTEPTLRHVLLQTGLTDTDLDAIANEARDLGDLPPDTPFDASAVEPESVSPSDDDAPVEMFAAIAAIEDATTVDEPDADEPDPDLLYDDAPTPDANGEIEGGYDESELDDGEIDDSEIDDSEIDADEPPPYEPPSQQLSLF